MRPITVRAPGPPLYFEPYRRGKRVAQRKHWADLYETALFERNPQKIPERIQAARKAIVERLRDLQVECEMLERALKKLRTLRSRATAT